MAQPGSGHQLDWWLAYNEVEPFGERRADLRSGIAASVLGNLWIASGNPLEPEMFDVESHIANRKAEQDYERQAKLQQQQIRVIAAAHNARSKQ